MVKTPQTRHSKTKREPVTIDLDPDAVKRVPQEAEKAKPANDPKEAAGANSESATSPAGSARPPEAEAPKPEAKPEQKASATGTASASTKTTAATGPSSSPAKEKPEKEAPASSTAASASSGRPAGGPTSTSEPKTGSSAGRERRGAGASLAAGLAGGVIALVLGGALQWAGVVPTPARNTENTTAELASLRQELSAVQSQIAEVRETAGATAGSGGEELAQATERINQLESGASTLRGDLDQLRSTVESGGAGENAGLDALQTRIAELETKVDGLAQAGGAAPDMGPIEERVAGIEQQVGSVNEAAASASSAAATNADRLSALEAEVKALAEQVSAQDEQPRMARVVAASALKSAVERGEPFTDELETFAAVAANDPSIETLRPFAAEGIPTRTALSAEASQAATQMLAATRPAAEDGGVIDRLMASARSLVTVRPVGNVEGEDPASIVARMETAVTEGDYRRALSEYEKLPENAKAAGAEFAEKLKARLAADEVVDKALSDALKPA